MIYRACGQKAFEIARFALQPVLQGFVLWTFLIGGPMLWAGVPVFAVLLPILDELSGDDFESPKVGNPVIFDLFLYATFVLTGLLAILLIYQAGTFSAPWLEFVARTLSGVDVAEARANTNNVDLAGGAISLGIVFSAAAGNSGHELVHRPRKSLNWHLGHWLLALVFNTNLTIEHVFGHHRDVGLSNDPTTAQRGVSFWSYMPRVIIQTNIYAWRFEQKRLGGDGRWLIHRNQVFWGYCKSGAIAVACFAASGGPGLAVFIASALVGRVIIEAFNYCGHYGLVRVPGRPVRPRHSWNSFRRLSTSLMFNLPRHASHHLSAARQYWQLGREPEGPVLPFGIVLMAIIAMFPPLWFRVIGPKIADWDRAFASANEINLLSAPEQN
jgi:fatty acid desaturase